MRANLLRGLVMGAVLTVLGAVTTPLPAASQSHPSLCPIMTDSITRLYRAYFGREPDTNGFNQWVARYQSGEWSLEEISQEFAESDEFQDRGHDTPEQFVDWIYSSDLGSGTDPSGRQYWIDALRSGYPRGSMVLTFTESRHYVTITDTTIPLAGFLRWYPKGTRWYCDIGPKTVPMEPIAGGGGADYYFRNRAEEPDQVGLWTLDDGERHVTMNDTVLQAGFTDYDWDGQFTGDGHYGDGIEVRAGSTTDWIVVFYPDSIGPERLGWQLT
jgi:hypothetical protein